MQWCGLLFEMRHGYRRSKIWWFVPAWVSLPKLMTTCGGASVGGSSRFSQGLVDRPPIYLFVVLFLLIDDWMWKI